MKLFDIVVSVVALSLAAAMFIGITLAIASVFYFGWLALVHLVTGG